MQICKNCGGIIYATDEEHNGMCEDCLCLYAEREARRIDAGIDDIIFGGDL